MKDFGDLKTTSMVIQRFSHPFNLKLVNITASTQNQPLPLSLTHTHPLGGAVFPIKLIHKSGWRDQIDSEITDRCTDASRSGLSIILHQQEPGLPRDFQVWGKECTR